MTAKEMFEKFDWVKAEKPQNLNPTFDDYYSEEDVVYEHFLEGKMNCRLYFIATSSENVYGYSLPKDISLEENVLHHLAIHQQMKELGWIK